MGSITMRLGPIAAMVLAFGVYLAIPATAAAAAPSLFNQIPSDGNAGAAAGQLDNPRGIAADPNTGHIFVAEAANQRISEFTAWGVFIKAWGWDVAPGAVDEEQEVQVRASEGQFTLSFGAATTPDLAFNASPEDVEAALNGLASIGSGGGSVSVTGGPGNANGSSPYLVSFDGGPLAGANVAQLIAADGTTPLGGGNPGSGASVSTRAHGVSAASTGLESCTIASGCKQGVSGSGAGQLKEPIIEPSAGVAVDSSGNIYVAEKGNRRVQKFDSSGAFLLMFGGEVNKTTAGNVCTRADIEGGDVCGIGITGTANGQFDFIEVFARELTGDFVDVGPNGMVFVGDKDRIQKFNPDGTYASQLPLPSQRHTKSLAVDPVSGDVYVALGQKFISDTPEVPVFYRLDEVTGAVLDEIEAGDPEADPFPSRGFAEGLAVDSAGNVYVITTQHMTSRQDWQEVLVFDSAAQPVVPIGSGFAEPPLFTEGIELTTLATGAGCGVPSDSLYIASFGFATEKSFVRAYGSSPDANLCPPPPRAPSIDEQYVVSVEVDGATVRAGINPHFWPDATFYVEYGTEECALGGCTQVLAPGISLGGKAVDLSVTSPSVFLGATEPLEPGATYHYRFVARSGGGGPVFGVDRTFKTFSEPDPPESCSANAQFRTGPSERLPDCRAYEMASPVDKDNGDASLIGEVFRRSQLNQGSIGGQRFTYSSYRAFANPQGAPINSQYMATRDPGSGWSTEAISTPRGIPVVGALHATGTEYKAFTDDLCFGWLRHDTDHAPFDLAAIANFSNLYQRDDCNGGSLSAITKAEPPIVEPNTIAQNFVPELQGFSADGKCTVFRANGKLMELGSDAVDSNGDGLFQVYMSCGEGLFLLSLLPNSITPCSQGASAGTTNLSDSSLAGRADTIASAVSTDASIVYWSCGNTLYVRNVSSGETTQVSPGSAQFWAAAANGSVALFTMGGDLFEFDLASGTATPVAEDVKGLLGTSGDASRVYLVSTQDLASGATAGEQNVYLRENGAFTFVAPLSESDVNSQLPFAAVNAKPFFRGTRVSADGRYLAFMSNDEELSELAAEYDNTDLKSGRADTEVYLYDAEAGEIVCVSCNPTGARAGGREFQGSGGNVVGVAAKLPTWETNLYPERALAEDGSRLYFESFEALELRDTNGRQDVYQWEAVGRGSCDVGDAVFDERSGGCVSLISSGESPEDSEFLDATPTGSDVFFATAESLLVQDYGLIDIYDAREGGGFPPPPTPKPPCEGEACQSPPAPPNDPTPASSAFVGPGDPAPGAKPKSKKPCPKGKHRVKRGGKTRCVTQGSKNRKQKKTQRGRAAR